MLINVYRFDLDFANHKGLVPTFVKQFNYDSKSPTGVIPEIMINDNNEKAILREHACLIGQKLYRKFNPKVIVMETAQGNIELRRCTLLHADKLREKWGAGEGRTKESHLVKEIKDIYYYMFLQAFSNSSEPLFTGHFYQATSKEVSGWFTLDHSEKTTS